MLPAMALRYVVLDFDGTCTQIDAAYAGFLATYRELLEDANGLAREALASAWKRAVDEVRAASPHAGWTLSDAPSTAPAAADPYILAGEVAALLIRKRAIRTVPGDAYKRAYTANPAPWRPEVPQVLAQLVERGLQVGFISNSERFAIEMRLTDLLHADPLLRGKLVVHGDAAKFKIVELLVGASGPGAGHRARFEQLDGAMRVEGCRRPIYLRRGKYFDALCGLWADFEAPGFPIEDTLVCGDVWELDLAMPRALGAAVHLIRRAKPCETYPYELAQLVDPQDASWDLHGLIEHVDRLRGKSPPKRPGEATGRRKR
jgi:FMN phosphatase YigB (HAD superfamily)